MYRREEMVHVPIQHDDTLCQALGLCGLNSDGDIGQKAEPVGQIRQAVMPRRAAERIGIIEIAACYGVDRGDGQPGRQRGQLITAAGEGDRMAQVSAACISLPCAWGHVGLLVLPWLSNADLTRRGSH